MSNKLKTLSHVQLERLISRAVGKYLEEEVDCKVLETGYEDFSQEDEIALKDDRSITLRLRLHYMDPVIPERKRK